MDNLILLIIGCGVVFSCILQIIGIFRKKPENVTAVIENIRKDVEKTENAVREEFTKSRNEAGVGARNLREEVGTTLKGVTDSLLQQGNKLITFNDQRFETLRLSIDAQLKSIQEDNSKRLDQIRVTVDEKLQVTLEKKLGDSFKQVSDRLEQVHKGLGEMQSLAVGVGDLKKVLSNVKARGVWGEAQLKNILSEILTPDQYGENVKTKDGSNSHVEFAIKFPGRNETNSQPLWLPIDCKFPLEDYHRLVDAQEQGNPTVVERVSKELEDRVRSCAKEISQKYLNPPSTTDFAILFLPIESLYAEVLRRPGLFEETLEKFHISIAGPTTLAALLNSLQMGFRTLAIERRSSEVWELLSSVKAEFGKFADVLDKLQKKLSEASNTVEDANKRTRAIERRLREVEGSPIELANGPEQKNEVA